jgi:hypothetical protein
VSGPDAVARAACFDPFNRRRRVVSDTITTEAARVGDSVEVNGLPGRPPKHGRIVDVLGLGEHVHFRVHWDDEHESLLYPTAGATVVHAAARHGGKS